MVGLLAVGLATLMALLTITAPADGATVDPRDEEVFSFEPEIVEENVAP